MLQALLKHCFRQCSSTASSMQKAYRVRVVRRTYGNQEQIRSREIRGRVTGQSLIAKSVAGLGSAGSGGLP
jgi:hypothetical protein